MTVYSRNIDTTTDFATGMFTFGGWIVDQVKFSPNVGGGDGTLKIEVDNFEFDFDIGNTAPVAAADAYSVDEDDVLNVVVAEGVLSNDTDVDGDALSAVLVSDVVNGSLTLNADGSFSYTPAANFDGSDSFTYKPNNGTVDGNTVTVSITVDSVNDAPVASDDGATTTEDGVLNGSSVLTNDSDLHAGAPSENNVLLTAQVKTGPTNGALILNADGTYTYTPDPDFNGVDSFTYEAVDSLGGISNVATVTITVLSTEDQI